MGEDLQNNKAINVLLAFAKIRRRFSPCNLTSLELVRTDFLSGCAEALNYKNLQCLKKMSWCFLNSTVQPKRKAFGKTYHAF